ncbi:MAG TPA: YkgJ family cysteine cluster protein [Dehalococcoidia bacterium]|nr:YkgJ family cysteine cluster protein [Dehalococcoidia bacterium]
MPLNGAPAKSLQHWQQLQEHFPRYALVLPGDKDFVCQPEQCGASCCRNTNVAIRESDRSRLEHHSGLPSQEFLECENGKLLTLPLAFPYFLSRRDGGCTLLGSANLCSQYPGRPDPCRAYPYAVLLIDSSTGWPARLTSSAVGESLNGVHPELLGLHPLLVRHVDCPGFTEDRISAEDWESIIWETAELTAEEE